MITLTEEKTTEVVNARKQLYLLLAQCFTEPDKDFAELAQSPVLKEIITRNFKILNIDNNISLTRLDETIDNIFLVLKKEYRQTFLGPIPPYVVPVESVYKPWAADNDVKFNWKGLKGFLMGDPAIDMIKRYQTNGMVIPDRFKNIPDHVSLVFEFAAVLCETSEKEQEEFCMSHLDWINDMNVEINCLSLSGFYKQIAQIAAQFVDREKNLYIRHSVRE